MPRSALLPLLIAPMLLLVPAHAAGTLPTPWKSADVGKVGVPGSASVKAGVWTVTASGEDIYGTADSFRFTYRPLRGDGQITARVVSYQRKDMWTKVGVMVRATTDAGAPFADVLVTPDHGAEFQHRDTAAGETQTTDQEPSPTPYWVKLTRVGTQMTGYVSKDGIRWDERGKATITLAPDVLIGICVTSHKNDSLTEAKIDLVKVKK